MAKPELSLSVPAGGKAMPPINQTVDASRAAAPPTEGARRAALHSAAHQAHVQEAEALEAAPAREPREDIESLEVKLPDGKLIVFGPPTGVALQMRIAGILGPDMTAYTAHMMKTIMSVRTIDGKAVPVVGNQVDAQRVANMVGEEGLDLLGVALNTYWPPVTISDLAIVKKNLRQ